MSKNRVISILILCFLIFALINCANASTYYLDNSTDVGTISKMVSGKTPINNNKYIKNGDVIKFKAGNYNGLKLIVKKRITLTTSKNGKNKVYFIGENEFGYPNEGTYAISVNAKKVKIVGLKFKYYDTGVKGTIQNSLISKNTFYYTNQGIMIKGSRNKIKYNKIIRREYDGISVKGKYNIIYKNKFSKILNNFDYCIAIDGKYNKIYNNKISKAGNGISINSDKNIIKKNSIYTSTTGISLFGENNKIISNKIKDGTNGISICLSGNQISNNKIEKIKKIGIIYTDNNNIKKNYFKSVKKNKKNVPLHYFGEI